MRNSWQEDGICTGGGNNSGRRHCQLLARRFRATLQAWATGWEIGWEQPGWETKQELQRGAFSGAYKGATKSTFPGVSGAIMKFHWRKMEKEDMYMWKKRFLTWNLGDDMGMAQQAAEDPMHQIQGFIMAKSSFSRCIDGGFGLCPNYLGLYYTPGPIVSPLWLVLWAPLMLRIYNVHCLKSLVLTLKSMFWPVESPSLTVNREFCGLNRYFHFWWLPWPFLPVLNSDFQPRRRDQCICQQHPFWLRLSMHQENCQRGRPWLISWSWVCYKIYKCDNKSIHISIRTKPYD